jgi:acetoin utilization protein AcuC
MTPAAVVWDEALLGYKLAPSHPLNPIRLDLTIRLARELGVLDGVDLLEPPMAPDDELLRVHTPAYLRAVKAASVSGEDDLAHGLGTPDNPVFEHMHEASALVAGGSLAAAEQIASDRHRRAVNIAGGLHHAMPDQASGFCVYNDAAIAIAWLLDHGFDRIAYVDIDVHHGDGVQAVFYRDPRVLTISLHQHPMTLFPQTGHPHELGEGDGYGTAVNVALPPGTTDPLWHRAFHAVVPSVLRAFRPQLLVTQCGVDTHREDPLAELRLSVDGHRSAYRTLRDLANELTDGRWLALGGGGYSLFRVVPRSWTHLLATQLDRDVPQTAPVPAGWIAYAASLVRDLPLPTTMSDDVDVTFEPWAGDTRTPVDTAILATRRAAFPLLGLDPDDPRD